MKTYKCLIFVNTLLITFACGKSSLQRYAPSTTYPRAIYVENQIDKIWTEGKIETDKFLYVDISLDNGRKWKINSDIRGVCRIKPWLLL